MYRFMFGIKLVFMVELPGHFCERGAVRSGIEALSMEDAR
jgi:hypothetical protein